MDNSTSRPRCSRKPRGAPSAVQTAIAALLVSRGISDPAAAQTFLNPTIDDLIDPMLMLGMDLAVARIQRAVRAGEPILIYGDYDVDGTTATVLLKTAIERIAPKEKPARRHLSRPPSPPRRLRYADRRSRTSSSLRRPPCHQRRYRHPRVRRCRRGQDPGNGPHRHRPPPPRRCNRRSRSNRGTQSRPGKLPVSLQVPLRRRSSLQAGSRTSAVAQPRQKSNIFA